MQTSGETKPWEWAILVAAVAGVILMAAAFNISPKWENASAFTAIVFLAVILGLRPAWRRGMFWRRLAGIFVIHVIIIAIILQFLPVTSEGLHGIPMIIATMAEGLLIIRLLSRGFNRSFKIDSPRSSDMRPKS